MPTKLIEDKRYFEEYVKPSSASEIAGSNKTAEINDTRIGNQVNFDEVPRSVDDSGPLGGYEEELLDIVQEDNTAGQRYFLTKLV